MKDDKVRIAVIADPDIIDSGAFEQRSPESVIIKYNADGCEFRLYTPDTLWPFHCDVCYIYSVSDAKKRRFCIETAWRNSLPVLLNWLQPVRAADEQFAAPDELGVSLARELSPRETDFLQDMLDKVDALIFVSEEAQKHFNKSGLRVSQQVVLPPPATEVPQVDSEPNRLQVFLDSLQSLVCNRVFARRTGILPLKHGGNIYMEITDLTKPVLLNGVPRGMIEYALYWSEQLPGRVRFAYYDMKKREFLEVSPKECIAYLKIRLDRFVPPDFHYTKLKAVEGDIFFVVSVAWMLDYSYTQCLASLTRDKGLLLIPYVHDLIKSRAVDRYSRKFVDHTSHLLFLSRVATYFITNSFSSQRDAFRFFCTHDQGCPPIPLGYGGADFRIAPTAVPVSESLLNAVAGKSYILCVSGFEFRKNHILIYNVYKRLICSFGSDAIPDLVCIGADQGFNEAVGLMRNDPWVRGKIHLFHGIAPHEVDWLYKNCLFTVYPSTYEGYGLPVAESLAYGKVCIAGNISSMAEIAPRYTDLLDPYDFATWYSRVCSYIFHPERLKAREREIRAFSPMTWEQVAHILYQIFETQPCVKPQCQLVSLNEAVDFAEKGGHCSAPGSRLTGLGFELPDKEGILTRWGLSTLLFRARMDGKPLNLSLLWQGATPGTRALVYVNGKLLLDAFPVKENAEMTFVIPPQPIEDGTFSNIRLDIRYFGIAAASVRMRLAKLALREPTDAELAVEHILAKLSSLAPGLDAVFRAILIPGWEIGPLNQVAKSVFHILLWAWQQGIYEDFRLCGLRVEIFEALKKLHEEQRDGQEGSAFLRGLWLTRPDLQDAFPQLDFSMGTLASWFENDGAFEYNLPLNSDGTLGNPITGQTAQARRLLQQTRINLEKEKTGENACVKYDDLNLYTGFVPLIQFSGEDPSLLEPVSQLVTSSQFDEGVYYERCAELGQTRLISRAQWEQIFILQVLHHFNAIERGEQGLVFVSMESPLPAAIAASNVHITISPLLFQKDRVQQPEASELDGFWNPNLLSMGAFRRLVKLGRSGLERLPREFEGRFDFVLSAGMAGKLGSIEAGQDFILESLKCLKPGGLAVHTLDLNISDLEDTFDVSGETCFRKRDIEWLLTNAGCEPRSCNWCSGTRESDKVVNFAPLDGHAGIKNTRGGFVVTSMGLIIMKDNRE